MKANEYECSICHGIFKKATPESEALAEMLRDFGPVPVEERRLVCDECYQRIKPEEQPLIYEEFLKEQNERNKRV